MLATWKHFKLEDFACPCCGANEINYDFVTRLDMLRDLCNFPLIVTSGYRCPAHNAKVSTTGEHGPHTTGRAADLSVRGAQALYLVGQAFALNFRGVGVSQRGDARFIHVDDLPNADGQPRPMIWSY